MTYIAVWDILDIYLSAMSDLAAPVSSRAWTWSPAISSCIQNGDSTASGPLKPYVVWLDTEKHFCNGLPLCSMRRLAGRLFTTSRQFFVGALVGVQVHRPLCICVHGPKYCLRSLVCSKMLTHLGAGSCGGILLIHAGLWLPHVSLHVFQNRQKPICRLLVCRCLYGFFGHHLVFFFTFSLLLQGHLCCCSESISLYCSQQLASKGSVSESHQKADYFTLFAHCPCCWCFLLASVWSNVAFSVSTNSLLLTQMRHEKEVQHGWCEYPANHDLREVSAPREPEPQPLLQQRTDAMSWTAGQPICACCKGVGHYANVSLYQARLQGATNSSTVTILYIARYC